MGKGDFPCRSRPRSRFPAPPSIRCRSTIGLFCLLWSFAFVAGKIGVTDCPPLILLAARFSLAGILILGITALRGEAWSLAHLARCRHLRDPRRRQQRALSRPRLYRAADRIRRPRRPDRQRQSGVHRRARRGLSRRGADLAQGDGAPARHRRRRLHRLASHVGRDRCLARHPVHAGLAGLDRGRHHPVQGAGAEGQPVGRQRRAESRRPASCCCRSRSRWPMSATSCRARGCSARSPSSCSAVRSSPICSGFIC